MDGGRWFDNRTSLIMDPLNGHLPPMTPEAEERRKQARARRFAPAPAEPETPTQELARLDPGVLCRGGNALLTGRGYNSNYQIFQTIDMVAIRMEMYHESRFIPIGDAEPGQLGPRSKMGSSRGHWERDTLVVETTNLLRGTSGSTRDVKVIRTVFAGRSGDTAVRVHAGRSVDLDTALDRAPLHAAVSRHRRHLRVRLSRGELCG